MFLPAIFAHMFQRMTKDKAHTAKEKFNFYGSHFTN
jgi:hypothetical protein